MAYRFLVGSADSISHSPLGCDPSPTVNLNPTHRPYSSAGWLTVDSLSHLSGRTSQLSQSPTSPAPSISSTEDSHARTSALQAAVSAWRASEADCFSRYEDSLPKSNRPLSFWKTSQPLGHVEQNEWGKNWPASGMIVAGRLYPLPKWELHISDRDGSSLLPTPTASSYGTNRGGGAQGREGKVRPSLEVIARQNLWPTPGASDGEKGGPGQALKGKPSLVAQAIKVSAWPTPTVHDSKGGNTPKTYGRHSESLAVSVASSGHQGFLNPQFVEVMMGYCIGWTVLGASEMQWFQSRRRKRSAGSRGGTDESGNGSTGNPPSI